MSSTVSDNAPEKSTTPTRSNDAARSSGQERQRTPSTARTASVLIAFIALAAVFFTKEPASWISGGTLPLNPLEAADVILRKTPVIVRRHVPRLQFQL